MIVDAALYREGKRQSDLTSIDEMIRARSAGGGFIWIGLSEPTQEEFDTIINDFDFHPLAVEDAVNANQRPKVENYRGLTFCVTRTVLYNQELNHVSVGELHFFIATDLIVVVRHGKSHELSNVRANLETSPEILSKGPWIVFYSIMDREIDHYIKIAAELESATHNIERSIFSGARESRSSEIYKLKRQVVKFRHAIEPLQLPLETIINNSAFVTEETTPFFRDLRDHLYRAAEMSKSMDEILTEILNVDLAHIQVQQNIDVRKISAWVALASTPTTIAGIYGMNFHHMPELSYRYAYPTVLGVMALVDLYLYFRFKKAGWL